jgi:hypothetical protein
MTTAAFVRGGAAWRRRSARLSRAENAEDMMPIDENNFTFEIEDVSFQMIHGELSTIKGGSETVHDN